MSFMSVSHKEVFKEQDTTGQRDEELPKQLPYSSGSANGCVQTQNPTTSYLGRGESTRGRLTKAEEEETSSQAIVYHIAGWPHLTA